MVMLWFHSCCFVVWGHVGANGKPLSRVEKFELHLTHKKNGESII